MQSTRGRLANSILKIKTEIRQIGGFFLTFLNTVVFGLDIVHFLKLVSNNMNSKMWMPFFFNFLSSPPRALHWENAEEKPLVLCWAIFCNTSEGGGVATPLWIFYNKRPIGLPLCLLPMYSYQSPLSIDTKISTIGLCMTPLWRHNLSANSKFWPYWNYTQKKGKNQFSAKKS